MKFAVFSSFVLLAAGSVSASPLHRRLDTATTLKNGQDAIALNDKFKSAKAGDSCSAGDVGCVGDQFAMCVNGKLVAQACASGTTCAALPLVNKAGTSIACTTQADLQQRIAATGANGGSSSSAGSGTTSSAGTSTSSASATSTGSANNSGDGAATGNNSGNNTSGSNSGDLQSSLTLDSSVIAKGFEDDGNNPPADGQSPSATSSNNFINFCATTNLPLTNGQQIKTGSCNPAPMGIIASTSNMPSSKFVFPPNLGNVTANKAFTIKMKVQNLQTGTFTNAQKTYYAAPQTVNSQGNIIGHTHVVIQKMDSMTQTTPLDPSNFAFFLGVNAAADGQGIVTADVTDGLDPGVYRLSSINSAANHQPVLVAVAQHGSLDDQVYFTVQ